ncbi:YdcF family protein [Bosea sp. 124]|uniref:YdcF family protein n=1 Tax=Bosea sp. 124 TaxID=2135642 RepID=UPI000D3A711F|nr:YdcF family protein [Bosea sp. 124]
MGNGISRTLEIMHGFAALRPPINSLCGIALFVTALFVVARPIGFSMARNQAGEMPTVAAGIIVLGGGLGTFLQYPKLDASSLPYSRVGKAVQMAKAYPEATILYTGRESSPGPIPVFQRAGIAHQRILWEDRSSNTAENATFSAALVHPQPMQRWILVTDDWHMARAEACFRQAGFNVTPAPVKRLGSATSWTRYQEALGRFAYAVLGLCSR